MSEKSVIVKDDHEGHSIAFREAVEKDPITNEIRIIERVDFASGKMPESGSLILENSIYTDNFDLTVALQGTLIDVGDKTTLFVSTVQTKSNGYCMLTPLIYDENDVIIGRLESRLFEVGFGLSISASKYLSDMDMWDCVGAYKIGIHVSEIGSFDFREDANPEASNSIDVYAWVI